MNKDKQLRVLSAATQVFAAKGYHKATISEIVTASRLSTGLVYSYFLNKDDIMLSIILGFLKKLNNMNRLVVEKTSDPMEALLGMVDNFISLCDEKEELPLMKVLNETLPQVAAINNKKLLAKRAEIYSENAVLLRTLDGIIISGQKAGLFETAFNPSVMRTVLGGSIRVVLDGLYYSQYKNMNIGYDTKDARKALIGLVEKYVRKQPARKKEAQESKFFCLKIELEF
jgi:AcrR family transcriptional regulator